jgi:ABC-type multidrug transport system ATPase subunit
MQLEGVGKRYGIREPWVVRDVWAQVPDGRLIRVAGRNGSGKSTLLRVIAGVTAASRGRVTGRPRTGYVPERFPGGLPFSGREYLLHMARLHGLRGAAGGRAVDEWLARLGATPYADQALRSLSKGMCQKVAIAQALLPSPGLLVLDEAWTGLDQSARGALDAAVLERVADGATVFFVDHDQARLAGRPDERWQFGDDGRVTISDDGPGQRVTQGTEVSVIEIDGIEPDSLHRLADLPGVLECSGTGPEAGRGRARIRVDAARSDEVLRHVLGWDGVHVAGLQAGYALAPAGEDPEAEHGALSGAARDTGAADGGSASEEAVGR